MFPINVPLALARERRAYALRILRTTVRTGDTLDCEA